MRLQIRMPQATDMMSSIATRTASFLSEQTFFSGYNGSA